MIDRERTIRRVTRRDLSDLLALENELFPEPWSRSMLLDEITNTVSRRYTVAVQNKKIVGYLGAMFVLDEMHINTIGTTAQFQHQGVATDLLRELWPAAMTRGCTKATLEVASSNVNAQALYRRFGFAPVGLRKNYYAKIGEDALVLWADLVELPTSNTATPTL